MSDAPQNIYDDPEFLAGYATLERFGHGWTRAVEHADFMALLPNVDGKRVLDLGCGLGQLALHLAEQGAAKVVAVDLSERMLALAQTERAHPRITYRREALEHVMFDSERFDLVVSSLAFHYVEDYRSLIRRIADWLAPGGTLVFSTEHPIYTARLPNHGWVTDAQGTRVAWAIDHYGDDGRRDEQWFVEGVRKYHRSMSTLLNGLVEAGLTIDRIEEPVPTNDRVQRRPQDADEQRRPMFLLVRASRPTPQLRA